MENETGDAKSPFLSKTLHFNSWSAVLAYAIWPFVPGRFRQHEYALPAVIAWFTIGNFALRFITKQAITFLFWRTHEKIDSPSKPPVS